LEALGYFIEGSASDPGEEVVLDLGDDEAVVFEEFFAARLWMLPKSVLTDILLKFRVQLHQLTPNAFTLLSKYFWAVLTFGGKPSGDGFGKHYELDYQQKKVDADGVEKFQQFGCINFHAWQGVGAKLTPAIKNKWSVGWTKAWFYCKVPTHMCAQGGEAMYHLHSHMCSLDFRTEPPFHCHNNNSVDAAFVRATKFIRGRDAVEEFVACGMHPLAIVVGFDKVATLMTPASRLRVPLPKYEAVHKDDEDNVQFLARVELEAEGIMGSCTRLEHDACVVNNRGSLNRVFELAEVAYGPQPEPSVMAEASSTES
jgi:hypothetical protein